MSKYKIILTDHVYPDLDLEHQKFSSAGADFLFLNTTNEEEILKEAADADAIITCYANITRRIIENTKKCKSISKTGIGVNNIDIDAATEKGIRVLNCPDYCVEEVSDHTLALFLSAARRVNQLAQQVKGGVWKRSESLKIRRLRGQTFGLLGFGKIARLVAEKVKPFGLEILCYDPYISEEVMRESGVFKAKMEDVLKSSDFLSLNLPLTKETKNLINSSSLSLMKKTACIINTSRGPLIDEAALYDALKNNKIGFAALDVLNEEKYDPNNPLFTLENIIITPHAAFYSEESTEELRKKIADDIVRVLEGKEPKYQVNRK